MNKVSNKVANKSFVDFEEVGAILRGDSFPASTLRRVLSGILGIGRCDAIIKKANQRASEGEHFISAFLDSAGIQREVSSSEEEQVPEQGGLLMISNHPHGGADALALMEWCCKLRPEGEFRILANRMMLRITGLGPWILPVEIFDHEDYSRENASSIRAAITCLKRGGIVAIFPSGEVSRFSWSTRSVVDQAWSKHVVSLARLGRASVVPIFFPGKNSFFFQMAGLIHPFLRTMLLPREFLRLSGKYLRFFAGKPVLPETISAIEDNEQRLIYLRDQVYSLAGTQNSSSVTSSEK